MALILIRAMNKKKALNCLADLERHAKLNIIGKPKSVSLEKVYNVTKRVIKQNPRDDIKLAILVKVEQNTTDSIMQIRKIHPPAHVIVVSEEYPEYKELMDDYNKSKVFDGYYSSKKNKK
ncbi:MAG: DUF356 domain-containing protein [Methanosphaera sp.]|uniref:DUF356 domain-containing protein n=1 Tax=Methanosphaera sp. ISO3-F5 TaxID=1452353 RepID=UPI002B25E55A|nr:DUF356 domain-containing protein [Methanosphaera sp. ISO3-F5]MBR0473325.1 DUF356 domain-containing protein [Methanosphaera sp.]WQH64502.1 DUF356 domain-containing protein [Methanosphaera sp. ISO3-F5]